MYCVIFDLDGTLCDTTHREHILRDRSLFLTTKERWNLFYSELINDSPIVPNVNLVKILKETYYVIYLTARPEKYRDLTNKWVSKYIGDEFYSSLIMREDEYLGAVEYKEKAYEELRKEGYEPILILDDDLDIVKMFKEKGLPAFYCGDISFRMGI